MCRGSAGTKGGGLPARRGRCRPRARGWKRSPATVSPQPTQVALRWAPPLPMGTWRQAVATCCLGPSLRDVQDPPRRCPRGLSRQAGSPAPAGRGERGLLKACWRGGFGLTAAPPPPLAAPGCSAAFLLMPASDLSNLTGLLCAHSIPRISCLDRILVPPCGCPLGGPQGSSVHLSACGILMLGGCFLQMGCPPSPGPLRGHRVPLGSVGTLVDTVCVAGR